jgi:RNA polymerase sigma factor (sigma-70 family)
MATAQLEAVLRHIRNLTADEKVRKQTDGALLRGFLIRNDQPAFEALVRRHGPMVLRVCLRTLGHVHDAEDALQATFLVLARHAASIRKRESLASWLHGVAYRMATHAKRAAARRHKHESRANATQPRDPALSVAWQELQVLLDEEIGGLPETLRAPFIYCCLENKSCDEAARQLGLEEGTVWKRLSRARKLLRGRLIRRGVSLTAVLATLAVSRTDASTALAGSLIYSTARAAVQVAAGRALTGGAVTGHVVALVEGVNKAMLATKIKVTAFVLLTIGIAALGLGTAGRQLANADGVKNPLSAEGKAREEERKEARPATAEAKKDDVSVEVSGQVLDPDGKGVARAELLLAVPSEKGGYQVAKQAASDENGLFTFTAPKAVVATSIAVAVAKNYAFDWKQLDPEPAKGRLVLRLVKDAPIKGRILDADGKAVAGAKVTVTGVSAAKEDERRGWVGPLPGQPAVLTTDAEGRLQLAGVGRDRIVSLHLEGPAIATADLNVEVQPVETTFEHQAAVSRPIRGVVSDKATGKPLAGVSISVNLARWRGGARSTKAVVTDKEGRYELLGLDKLPSYPLALKPGDGLYFQRSADLRDTAGLDALTADIEVVQGGVTVRGKVTDKATGKPVANARVDYHPLYPNRNVERKLEGFWHPRSETTTGPDGSYVLTVLPGPGVIGVAGPKPDAYIAAQSTIKERKDFFKVPLALDGYDDPTPAVGENALGLPLSLDSYNAMVLLEPGEKEEALVKDVALEEARTLKGRVVGPDGQPLTGVMVVGLFQRSFDTLKTAEFTVRGINSKANRQLVFHHKAKKLGFFLKELRGDASEPLTVELQPCGSASGRIVDGDGQPVPGLRISLSGWGGGEEARTDNEGRFLVEGLVPGLNYAVIPGTGFFILAEVTVESGKQKVMGDVKLRK